MPQELGLPVFPLSKNSDTKPGDKVVTMGEYIGETESKMGVNYNFLEPKTGRHVVLSGGAIRWRIEQGHIVEGGFYDITWNGKSPVGKGQWAGKEAHDFKFAVYRDDEVPAEYRSSRPVNGASAADEDPTPSEEPVSEAMDDLE